MSGVLVVVMSLSLLPVLSHGGDAPLARLVAGDAHRGTLGEQSGAGEVDGYRLRVGGLVGRGARRREGRGRLDQLPVVVKPLRIVEADCRGDATVVAVCGDEA